MNPIRVFAKMATRVPPPDMQPGSTGEPPIDAGHAAALCAGLAERPFRAALAKYALDPTVARWLSVEVWRVAMEKAQRSGWKTAGQTVNRCGNRLCLSLIDTLEPGERVDFEEMLDLTDGVEYTRAVAHLVIAGIYDNWLWGQKEAWQKKAAVLGVGHSSYFETWRPRIAEVENVVDDWAGIAYHHVRRRQREQRAA